MKIITIGSDPEFFVLDDKGNPYPATPFAEGTKEQPKPIPSLGEGFFEQRDNLSFEGNIPVCNTKEEFIENITKLRNYFLSKVSKYNYSISSNGVEYFPERMLVSPEAMEFGCSSVISSWSSCNGNRESRATPVLSEVKYRVSGFHIHIGIERELGDPLLSWDLLIGRLFDLFLTIPSHAIKPEPERIESYGAYGIIRSKTYGVECRTLSTFFTQEEWLPWVWDQIKKMEEFINKCDKSDLVKIIDQRFVLTTIEYNFSSIFKRFDNKEVLNMFEETKRFYNLENINDVKKINIKKVKHEDEDSWGFTGSSYLTSTAYTTTTDNTEYNIYEPEY